MYGWPGVRVYVIPKFAIGGSGGLGFVTKLYVRVFDTQLDVAVFACSVTDKLVVPTGNGVNGETSDVPVQCSQLPGIELDSPLSSLPTLNNHELQQD